MSQEDIDARFGSRPTSFGGTSSFGITPLGFGSPPATFGESPLGFGSPPATLGESPLAFGSAPIPSTSEKKMVTKAKKKGSDI